MDDREEKKVAGSPKGKKSKVPFMIIGGVLVVALLVGGGIFAMKTFSAPTEAATPAETEEPATNPDGTPAATGIYYNTFPDFITVLAPSENYDFTYLKFKPELELSGEEALAEVGTKVPALSAKIDALMTDLDWDNIKTEKGRERQAEKLRNSLNELLESGEIVKVYFTSFVVQ
jgi:flagellar basal body-associated protein FliL